MVIVSSTSWISSGINTKLVTFINGEGMAVCSVFLVVFSCSWFTLVVHFDPSEGMSVSPPQMT